MISHTQTHEPTKVCPHCHGTGRINTKRGRRPTLTAIQILDIHTRLNAGELAKDVAADYGVTPSAISRIRHRRRRG